jgi:multiple antibiotic resistance protein
VPTGALPGLSPQHHDLSVVHPLDPSQSCLATTSAGQDVDAPFLTLTRGLSAESRNVLAGKIAVNSFGILIVSVLIRTHILAFFGISLPVIQVGGGLIVTAVGWKLLNRPDDDAKASESSSKPLKDAYLSAYLARRAFYSLTMPLTVGPGSISVAIAAGATILVRRP